MDKGKGARAGEDLQLLIDYEWLCKKTGRLLIEEVREPQRRRRLRPVPVKGRQREVRASTAVP